MRACVNFKHATQIHQKNPKIIISSDRFLTLILTSGSGGRWWMTFNCYFIKRLWRTDSLPAAELQTNTKLPLNADEQALFEKSREVSRVNVLIREEFIFEKLLAESLGVEMRQLCQQTHCFSPWTTPRDTLPGESENTGWYHITLVKSCFSWWHQSSCSMRRTSEARPTCMSF